MVDVSPFRGMRYREEVVGDLSLVVAPPYDVIDGRQRSLLVERSAYNVTHIELPNGGAERYARAAGLLRHWHNEGAVEHDPTPALYVLEERFTTNGVEHRRLGILGAVRVESWDSGAVLPHEHTLPGPKRDRLELLRTCRANISPIFLLYDDPERVIRSVLEKVRTSDPVAHITLPAGAVPHAAQESRLWMITDSAQLGALRAALATTQAYIADGHHRYETALTYRREMEEQHPGLAGGAWTRALMFLVATDEPGLTVLPIHRVIRNVSPQRVAGLRDRLTDYFALAELSSSIPEQWMELLQRAAAGSFIFIFPAHAVLAEPARSLKELLPRDRSEAWRELDVSVLHHLVLDPFLGLGEQEIEGEEYVSYTRSAEEAVEAVRSGRAELSVLVRPTEPAQLCAVARAHDRMPQKSTFFFPKPLTGLVIYDHTVV
ncbi:MAG: DUF1015 domain-containing protein [Chloroflexi bacterium]|nr:DUF1015 domain-containing protein [Chloroflexota bacterium]